MYKTASTASAPNATDFRWPDLPQIGFICVVTLMPYLLAGALLLA